jgi:hypothetical protein
VRLVAGQAGSKGVGLIYALYMMVIVVNSPWDKEVFKGQALENWVQDMLVLSGNSRATTHTLDPIFSSV